MRRSREPWHYWQTARLLSIATPPLSCVAAGGPYREQHPRCTHSFHLQLELQRLVFAFARSSTRDQQDETPPGTRSSRPALREMLATLCLRNLNASNSCPRHADVAGDIHVDALR
jgi:hypothetical protein